MLREKHCQYQLTPKVAQEYIPVRNILSGKIINYLFVDAFHSVGTVEVMLQQIHGIPIKILCPHYVLLCDLIGPLLANSNPRELGIMVYSPIIEV